MGYYMDMTGKLYSKKCGCKHNECELKYLNPDVAKSPSGRHKKQVICTCGKYIKFANREDEELLNFG